jgi:hypothetical protein
MRDGGDSVSNRGALASGKARTSPVVQTTLNLSAKAPFEECKVCDTVYNPQHPEDVRYHTKRHATVARVKRMSEQEQVDG